jgi:FtsZ-binding cell division protein ZapB
MTRIKEVIPNSGEIPEYKSPANRIVHSLRKGYDNLRSKLSDARKMIKYYQIRTRDLEKSREAYKKEKLDLKAQISQLVVENEQLKKKLKMIK